MKTLFCLIYMICFSAVQGAGLIFSQDLMQHPGSKSLSTPDIGDSLIYPESKPLNLVLIHPYNALLPSLIAMRVPSVKGAFAGDAGEHYVVISRPMTDETSLLLRPHYWVTRELSASAISGNTVVDVITDVRTSAGVSLLSGSHQVNVHGNVCSPSNMPLAIEMKDITHTEPNPFYLSPEETPGTSSTITVVDVEHSHLLYSRVEKPDHSKALTCHWIPKQSQWERIFLAELDGESYDTSISALVARFNAFMDEDPHWAIVRDLLTF